MSNLQAFAAAVYTPQTKDRQALSKFAGMLKSSNIKVGGVLQEALFDNEGNICGIDAVDVSSGQRIPISRPATNPGDCGLDISALTQTTGIIRQAISDRCGLIVVEKFGEMEQKGKGLIDEIMQTIVEEIPLLIAVSEAALPVWQETSGELGRVLPFELQAFEKWWQEVSSKSL
jgi:nucleoside-triphosphatase THEP1